MGINSKSLKSLGFEMKDGQLIATNQTSKPDNVKSTAVGITSFIDSKKVLGIESPIISAKQKKPKVEQKGFISKVISSINNVKSVSLNRFKERILDRINPYFKFLSVEDIHHIRVVNFIKDYLPNVVAFHVPNESKKSNFEKYKYSLMGALKGAPDFVFLHPRFKKIDGVIDYKRIQYLGLIIELKAPEHNRVVGKGKNEGKVVKSIGKASPEQIDVINKCNRVGYKACVCYGYEEAAEILIEYFYL